MNTRIQSILDTTAKRFDEKYAEGLNMGAKGNVEAYKSFIHAEQLAVLEAVREVISGLKVEENFLAKMHTESLLREPYGDRMYNHAIGDALSALDLNK